MDLSNLVKSIKDRQSLLTPELKVLQSELEVVYENNALESGVIDRGYYTAFNRLLNQYRGVLLLNFMVSEDEYSYNGTLVKIPVVDVTDMNNNSKRIFILPKFLLAQN